MKKVELLSKYGLMAFLATGLFLASCDNDDDEVVPEEENEEEVITDVKLIFTPRGGSGTVVEAMAEDEDGDGEGGLIVQNAITLDTSMTYDLTFEILNSLESPAEDIGEEIDEEKDEHQFFFSFSNNVFANPTGDGNIDANGGSEVNYNDSDGNGKPVGLQTSWTTSNTVVSGQSFTVRLVHEPNKDSNNAAGTGETDFEVTFVLNVQ